MVGGDRMLHHGYARKYAQYLAPLVGGDRRLTVVEIGILRGTGLAIWCDLFPNARVIGLDIDLGHFQAHRPQLERAGAFRHNTPEIYEFDQLSSDQGRLGALLAGDKIDVCIDDGFHTDESILATLSQALPHLADEFVYFIEDNGAVHRRIAAEYSQFAIDPAGELTVVSRKLR